MSALSELRQVFVTSWADLTSKSTGAIGLLYRLYVVENALLAAEVAAEATNMVADECQTGGKAGQLRMKSGKHSRITKILDGILLVWGLVVLTFHTLSAIVSLRGVSTGCLLETRPWGSSTYSCAVLEISCTQRHTSGQYTTIVDALDKVNPVAVQVLIFSHCTELEFPSTVQDLSTLTMLKVCNTTIHTWDEHAAFRQATNPMLQVLFFARVNMSTIPPGLLAPDFSEAVWDIEFCVTNLTTVPMEVVVSWQWVSYLVLEASLFITEMPVAILHLPSVKFYQFGMDRIRSIPDWAFAKRNPIYLFLDGNQLDQLPNTMSSLTNFYVLGIRNTNISDFPLAWMIADPPLYQPAVTVHAHGSPLCVGKESDDPNARTALGPFSINCQSEPASLITYPLQNEDEWRAAAQLSVIHNIYHSGTIVETYRRIDVVVRDNPANSC